MLSGDGQLLASTCVAEILRFFNGVFIFNFKYLFWQRACQKLAALHSTDR